MSMDLKQSPLWAILVEAVKKLPLYRSHKAYIRDVALIENPNSSAEELSNRLGAPLGEIIVILDELSSSSSAEGN